MAERETAVRLLTALAGLPERQRQVLELGYFSELSQSEIAGKLGLPLGTVKGRSRLGFRNWLRPPSERWKAVEWLEGGAGAQAAGTGEVLLRQPGGFEAGFEITSPLEPYDPAAAQGPGMYLLLDDLDLAPTAAGAEADEGDYQVAGIE